MRQGLEHLHATCFVRWLARAVAVVCLAITLNSAAPQDTPLVIGKDEIDRQRDWLESLGVHAETLLARPYDEPFTYRSFVVPAERMREARVKKPAEVFADALRTDLRYLKIVMARAYGGWSSAERHGWNWNAWFEKWDQTLAKRAGGKLSIEAAFQPFTELEEFQLDNHSGLVGRPGFGSGSAIALMKGAAPPGGCTSMQSTTGADLPLLTNDPAQQPKRALSPDLKPPAWYLAFPARRGAPRSVRCGNLTIPAEMIPPQGESARLRQVSELTHSDGDIPVYRVIDQSIGYLRLPTFSKENVELLRGVIRDLPDEAGKEKLLIVDLRMNDGGDLHLELFRRWLDLRALGPKVRPTQELTQSCFYKALRWGYTQYTSLNLMPPISEALRSSMQKQAEGLSEPSAEGCPRELKQNSSEWHMKLHSMPEHAKFLLIVDDLCGSDCEAAVYLFSLTGSTVIAGVNTFGVAQFIQPGYFVLPNTGLMFRIALGRSDLYGDDRSFDGYGFDVDVLLLRQEDRSSESILKLAQRLLNRE